jgi:hypothetical protein
MKKRKIKSSPKSTETEYEPFNFDIDLDLEFSEESSPERPDPDRVNCKHNRWPKVVPVLTQDDLCWNYSIRNRRFDLLMWIDITFDTDHSFENPKRNKAKRILEKVLAERLNRSRVSLWLFLEETWRIKGPSLAWQASCWNEAMSRLGFEIPEVCRVEPGDAKRFKRKV